MTDRYLRYPPSRPSPCHLSHSEQPSGVAQAGHGYHLALQPLLSALLPAHQPDPSRWTVVPAPFTTLPRAKDLLLSLITMHLTGARCLNNCGNLDNNRASN